MSDDDTAKEKLALQPLADGPGPLVVDTLDAVPSHISTPPLHDQQGRAIDKPHGLDLNHNVSGTINNPLQRIPRAQLLADAAEFAYTHNLVEHTELIQRGALVAQSPDPASWHTVPELSDDERDALHYESQHQWSQTWKLYMTIFVCSLGAATQGWDQTGTPQFPHHPCSQAQCTAAATQI